MDGWMLKEPPIFPPSIHPLHMAGDNYSKHEFNHVTPPFNKPLLLPQDFRIMLYCEKLSWSGPTYFWGLVVSYHICITSVTSRTLLNFQESHAIVTLHVYHVIFPTPQTLLPLLVDAWPTLLILLNSIQHWVFPKPFLTTLPGWIYFLLDHFLFYYRS